MPALIVPLIVCGGSGTRLWPASRASRPKQFLPLFGDLSTFQETVQRVTKQGLFGKPVVITNQDHRFLVADQLLMIGVDADIVLEPEARDSGPAIAAGAAFVAARDGEDTPVLALAADHKVRDVEGFQAACVAAERGAALGAIVTFGVVPDHAATGYGYIEADGPLAEGVLKVRRFVEKPDRETATRYVREGYLWNSGNFLFQAGSFLSEYANREPDTIEAVREAVAEAADDLGFIRLDPEAFARCEKRSVDYAVMEKTTEAAVVPATFDWSDVGSWDAVRELSPQDEAGNVALGDGVFVNSRRNMVSSEGQTVAVVGLDDLTVIATGDAVLVGRLDDAAGIKTLVERLKQSHGKLTQDHLQSYRPWGHYQSLDMGARHQVKRITVKPGGQLSLQKHHHRSEHWIVVHGVATIHIDGKDTILHENESTYIPIGATHRLSNPGKIELQLVEVQTGSYLGEDDIIRIEDIYNRAEE
jgi:mannose-1-phosphate guanylyltransferase/mannose-6-phosphate isomerase